MDPRDPVRVLVVGERLQELFGSQQLFVRNDCQCRFAKNHQEVAELPDLRKFDIVLSSARIPGESVRGLIALLSGSRACAFCSLRVEASYWWLPVLRFGRDCLGTPAFRLGDFAHVFDQLLKDLNSNMRVPS